MITIKQCDITKLEVECIVNAANESLLGGGGVDGAIHAAAGPKLLEECRHFHGCKTSEAVVTNGYNLPAKYIIHTVGPRYYRYDNPADADEALRLTYFNTLCRAKETEVHSIAFPSISTGVFGFPLDRACRIALNTIKEFLEADPDYSLDVIISCYGNRTEQEYRMAYSEIF